jgi:hypothetical protein
MMTNGHASDGERGTNRSRRLTTEDLSPEELRRIDVDALSSLRVKQLQDKVDVEAKQAAEAMRRSKVGVYSYRRSLLMPVTEYIKLAFFIALSTAGYFGIRHLLKYAYAQNTALLQTYLGQLTIGVVVFFVLMTWLVLRIYHVWAGEHLYADVDHVRRSRKPIWFLGITKVSFQVNTSEARCNPEPTNFEMAIRNIGFDASTVDIDTPIQKDKPLHDLKFVKRADELEAIINS